MLAPMRRGLQVGLTLVTCWCFTACSTTADLRQTDPAVALPASAAVEAQARPARWDGELRSRSADVVMTAMAFIDQPYRAGGTNAEHGFDCSGFTRHVFAQAIGFVLPRQADEQAQASGLRAVAREQLRPGDLVFFNTLRRTFSHVGIYLGDGRFIHAPRSGAQVRVESMAAPYWTRRFTGARRAEPLAPDS